MPDEENVNPQDVAQDLFSDVENPEEDDFYADAHNEEVITTLAEDGEEPAPQEETGEEKKEETPKEEPKAVDWQKRYTDLQSYHDKTKNELREKLQELEGKAQAGTLPPDEVQGLVALRDVMANDPEIMNFVQNRLQGQGTQQAPDAAAVSQTQQAQLPPKPEDFDPMDVYDTSTSSGQWYAQVESIKEQQRMSQIAQMMQQGITQSNQTMLQQLEQKRQEEQRRSQQQEQVRAFWEAHQDIPPEERDAFIQFVQKGPQKEITLDHLYQLHQVMNGGTIPETHRPEVDIDSKIKQAQTTVPPSMSQIPSGEEELSEDDMFAQSMFAYGQRNNSKNLI